MDLDSSLGPNLTELSEEDLILECVRREKVAHTIWNAIIAVYGPNGFLKVLDYIQSSTENKIEMTKEVVLGLSKK